MFKIYECPNCSTKARVDMTVRLSAPGHPCRGVGGVWVLMVPEGTRCEVKVVEREDYIGREMVRLDDNGRPIMAVVTTRDDGQDCTVFASTALGSDSNGLV